jgi:phosphoglucomutase
MAEITAWAIDQGKTLYELLQDIYLEYGYSKEKMKYVVRKGKSGADEIQKIMDNFRANPPKKLGGSPLEWVKDYETLVAKNLITGEQTKIDQKITSNVLQFFSHDGTKISVRPSGTEPKIKFYFEVKGRLESREQFDEAEEKAEARIDAVMEELGL